MLNQQIHWRKPSCKISLNGKEFAQIIVEKDALRIERGTHAQKIVPVWIKFGQFSGGTSMHLTPVRSSLVALKDLFDSVEILTIRHATVHMNGYIGRRALIGRAEPDIVGMHEANLDGKMHFKLFLVDALLNRGNHFAGILHRDVILHLVEAHHAQRREEAMAIVRFINVSDSL